MLAILPPCLSLCDTRYEDVYAAFHDSVAMDDFDVILFQIYCSINQ